jgi:hypothetical protein
MRRFEDKINLVIDVAEGSSKTYFYSVSKGYKHYFNCAHYLARISKGERLYYDYLCEQMDSGNNLIMIDNQLNTQFCTLLGEWTSGKSSVSVKSIPKFLSNLVEANLIHPYRTAKRGLYQVNPKYAYQGNDSSRKKLLIDEVRYRLRRKLPYAHLIDCSEDDFLKRIKASI